MKTIAPKDPVSQPTGSSFSYLPRYANNESLGNLHFSKGGANNHFYARFNNFCQVIQLATIVCTPPPPPSFPICEFLRLS